MPTSCWRAAWNRWGNIGQTNYAAAKAEVIGLTQSLALEGTRYDVRPNAVAPDFIETEMTQAIPDKVREKITAEIPCRCFGKPDEIAWAVAFLLSPVASSFVTSTVLEVNGGHLHRAAYAGSIVSVSLPTTLLQFLTKTKSSQNIEANFFSRGS